MSTPREISLCRYYYDPLDRLIGHSQMDLPESQRFFCKSRLATEVHGAIAVSILQNGDQLLAQRRRQNETLDVTLLATEQQRSVLCAIRASSYIAIAYSPYGHRLSENGLTSLLGFNGERPDPLTGHYLLGNGYRAFNPVLMRFNSPDSLSPFGKGGVNSYAYCLGDPINNSDPTGHVANPFSLLAVFMIWAANAKANLSIPVGRRSTRLYDVRPSAIENPGFATNSPNARPTTSQVLWSRSHRTGDDPGLSYHEYPSGVKRVRIVNRTEDGIWFDATPGSELDAILAQPNHPQHAALQSVHQRHSEINFQNHVSVANPRVGEPDPNRIMARLESGLSGNVPGLMPSVVVHKIRHGSRTGLTPAQLERRFPGHFNPSRRGG